MFHTTMGGCLDTMPRMVKDDTRKTLNNKIEASESAPKDGTGLSLEKEDIFHNSERGMIGSEEGHRRISLTV
jgi:hypothetical protein